MALTLADMMARYAAPGRIEGVFLRPARKEDMRPVEEAELTDAGFDGDHGRKGKRAVTLIQAEHLPVIATFAGLDVVEPETLRRNIVVSGLNLQAFRGTQLKIGAAIIELTVPCHPCSRMEAALGQGGYTAMRGHGGYCARVLQPGTVRIGGAVVPT